MSESTFVIRYSLNGAKRTLTGDFKSPKEAIEYVAAVAKEEGKYWHMISIKQRGNEDEMDSRFWMGCPELFLPFQPSSALDRMLWQSADHVVSFGADGKYVQKIIRRRNPEYTFGLDPNDKDVGFTDQDDDAPSQNDCMAHIHEDNPDVAKLDEVEENTEDRFDDANTEILEMPSVPDKWDLIYDAKGVTVKDDVVTKGYSSDVFTMLRDKKLKGYAGRLEKAIEVGSIGNGKVLYTSIQKWQQAIAKTNRFYSSPRNKYPMAQIARLWEIWNVKQYLKNPGAYKTKVVEKITNVYSKRGGLGMKASNMSVVNFLGYNGNIRLSDELIESYVEDNCSY